MAGSLKALPVLIGGPSASSPILKLTTPLLTTATTPGLEVQAQPPLSLWKFVFLSYFCVCGGPYGLELAVGFQLSHFVTNE